MQICIGKIIFEIREIDPVAPVKVYTDNDKEQYSTIEFRELLYFAKMIVGMRE
jgi:hypothetical protein